jgi:hypothetical protein
LGYLERTDVLAAAPWGGHVSVLASRARRTSVDGADRLGAIGNPGRE